jgi:uncharacterized protein YjiS (DUF1127 family)
MFDATAHPATSAAGLALPASVVAPFAALRRRAAAARATAARRATARTLLRLDAHLLDDVGLSRNELHRVLDGI